MKTLIAIVAVLLTVAYPAMVYFGLQRINPSAFAVLFLALAAAKLLAYRASLKKSASTGTEQPKDASHTGMIAVIVGFSVLLMATNSQSLLKFYPVIANLSIASFFLYSLTTPCSLIERFARLAGKTITPNAKRYTRRLTAVWGGLLILNAIAAGATVFWGSLAQWAMYNGLLSYGFFMSFGAAELVFRQFYIKRFGA